MHSNLYITGLFRSGTTLLSRAISANPAIHVSYQPLTPLLKLAADKFWRKMGQSAARPLGDPIIVERHWIDFQKDLSGQSYTSKELNLLHQQLRQGYLEDAVEKDKRLIERWDSLQGASFEELLASTATIIRDYLGKTSSKTIGGLKEIWGEEFIPQFSAAGFKCIHIIRDPRGIIASRNYGTYFETSCNRKKYPILFIARAWRRSLALKQMMVADPNYLLVRYEDFLSDPEKILQQVCKLVGTDFSPDMLVYENYRGGDGCDWRGNADSRQFGKIDIGGIDRWRAILPEEDIFLCEFLCTMEMNALGYELKTDVTDVDRFLSMQEDPLAADSWLADHSHILTDAEKSKEILRKGAAFEDKC